MSYAEPAPRNAAVPGAAEIAPPRARSSGFSPRTFQALRNPYFRLLFWANTLQFGSMQMQMLVRGVLVFQFTGSYAALGQVSLAHAIPGLVLTPLGGIIADRAPKRTVLLIAHAFNLANSWVLALLAIAGVLTFPHLLISAALQGAVNAVMMPTKQALVPDLVRRDTLMNAIALNTSGQNLMQLAGPGLGGVLLAFSGTPAAFGVMGAMYAVAFVFTARLPGRPVFASEETPVAVPARRRSGGLTDLMEGVRYVASDPVIRTLIAVNFIVIVVSMPYAMMLPGFVQDVLRRGPAELGVLMTVTGIGALGGSLVIASISERRRGRLLIITGFILGLSLLAFAISTNYYVTIPIMLVVGLGHAMRMSVGQVLVQHYSSDQYRGRVMAVWMMQYSLMSIGTYGVGVLSEWFGPQRAIGGMAVALVVLMPLVWFTMPLVRRID